MCVDLNIILTTSWRVDYLALEGRDELAVLGEDGEIEVVVIVGNGYLASTVDPHSDRVVGDSCARENFAS